MKEHLKKAALSYAKLKEETAINPISNIDAEIIVELLEALKKVGKTDLVAILDGWKYKKDGDVRDDLLTWNTEYNSEENQEEREDGYEIKVGKFGGLFINGQLYIKEKTRNFITLQGAMYELELIFNYSKIKEWSYDLPVGQKHGIKLNEHPDETIRKSIYADKKIFYSSIEERDKEFDRLNTVFLSQDNIHLVE
jgi:hypothetical protein